jgi:hypothetical protein
MVFAIFRELLLERIWKRFPDHGDRRHRVVARDPGARRIVQHEADRDPPPLILPSLRMEVAIERLDVAVKRAPVV